ncbi:probable carbohydrate esterase At4g34215 [Olea europaea var. sylvestris]|uniref:probable carbohydrate esterase At4g34215 n=1 Tax=Olea europaea var. sylvestris TaxID=158386 RepID=UPI000C1CF70D|nr:probable carbohydrate esterase At4g34215 [Olea europaea var. sylvestris]
MFGTQNGTSFVFGSKTETKWINALQAAEEESVLYNHVAACWTGYIPPECRSQPSIVRLNTGLTWEDSNIGVIGFVPCAFGGSVIADWRQGSPLYDRLMKRSKAALEDGGEIRALLWYQGESDTKKEVDAELYKKRIEEFFNVALVSGIGAYFDIVRKAQWAVKLPNVITVDAKGLQLLNDDPIHLSTPGQIRFGKMMADAFLYFD